MAYDDRYPEGRFRDRGRGRWRGDLERDDGPQTQWRGDPWFGGGGWGNQQPRQQRLGDRSWQGGDDPWADADRYGGDYGAIGRDSDLDRGGPGYDASFGGRFDRADFGMDRGFHAGATRDHSITQRHDPHYSEWRRRQVAELDRDYDEYRRENQSRFEREFGAWRERRGAQRQAVARVAVHMEVVGSDGAHVGTVDGTNGDDIVLTRSDPNAGGIHHRIPCGWVDRVEDQVILNLTAEDATSRWREESRSRALFERPNSRASGPHVLNSSFAGTYPDKK